MAAPASDTGAVSVDGYGNRVTELTSSRIFVGAFSGVSGRVFFLWDVDPHNGPMSGAGCRRGGDEFLLRPGLEGPSRQQTGNAD